MFSYVTLLAIAFTSAQAGVLAPSYPLAYAPAPAPIVHYEKTIPYNVPPFASSLEYSARSLYGVAPYAATPVAHVAGPVAQVSELLRTPHPADPAYPVAHAAPALHHHVAAPLAAPFPVAYAHAPALKAHHQLAYAASPYAYAAGVAHPYLNSPLLHHGVAPALYRR